MPDPRSAARRAAAEQKAHHWMQKLLKKAPKLDAEQIEELRPLLLAENVSTQRGMARGRKDGKGRPRGY